MPVRRMSSGEAERRGGWEGGGGGRNAPSRRHLLPPSSGRMMMIIGYSSAPQQQRARRASAPRSQWRVTNRPVVVGQLPVAAAFECHPLPGPFGHPTARPHARTLPGQPALSRPLDRRQIRPPVALPPSLPPVSRRRPAARPQVCPPGLSACTPARLPPGRTPARPLAARKPSSADHVKHLGRYFDKIVDVKTVISGGYLARFLL